MLGLKLNHVSKRGPRWQLHINDAELPSDCKHKSYSNSVTKHKPPGNLQPPKISFDAPNCCETPSNWLSFVRKNPISKETMAPRVKATHAMSGTVGGDYNTTLDNV